MSEKELASRQESVKQHVQYFRAQLDNDNDDILSPDEIMAWVSDDKRHLREKSGNLMRKCDKNRDGRLNIETEVLSEVKYFSQHELTRYGDLLFYQEEL